MAISPRKLRAVDADAELEGELPADKRVQDIAKLTEISDEVMQTIGEVFEGTGLMRDQRKVEVLLGARRDVAEAWGKTRDAFISIGRTLNDMDRELDEVERDRLRTGFRRLFPFSDSIASQFRAIARAVDDGRIPRDLVPGSYGAAYQMALLNAEQRVIAETRGLLRPDVSRETLVEFRRDVAGVQPRTPYGLNPARLRAELARLEKDIKRDLNRLVAARRRRREIRELLDEGKGA
jgi:hypothetical protein